jgi:hypothetical protein
VALAPWYYRERLLYQAIHVAMDELGSELIDAIEVQSEKQILVSAGAKRLVLSYGHLSGHGIMTAGDHQSWRVEKVKVYDAPPANGPAPRAWWRRLFGD